MLDRILEENWEVDKSGDVNIGQVRWSRLRKKLRAVCSFDGNKHIVECNAAEHLEEPVRNDTTLQNALVRRRWDVEEKDRGRNQLLSIMVRNIPTELLSAAARA